MIDPEPHPLPEPAALGPLAPHELLERVEALEAELSEARVETQRLRSLETAHQANLLEREARLNLTLSASGVGTWLWNVNLNTLSWDERMHEIFGTQSEVFVPSYEGFEATLHPDDREAVQVAVQRSLENNEEFRIEYRVLHPNGDTRYVEGRGAPTQLPTGTLFPGVCLDVTDRRNAALKLDEFSTALARSNADLERFAYVASHDLKAPLRAIESLSSWLAEEIGDSLSEEGGRYLGLLRGRVRRMEQLLDDLLEFSRAGHADFKAELIDTNALVQGVLSLLGLPERFEVIVADNLPTLETDRVALELVFRNLIDNASKHHHPEGGWIQVTGEAAADRCVFRVSDNGPGIPEKFRERVFEIFQTLKPRDEVEGSGMGLALIKRFVERQGGVVKIEDHVAGGTTLVVDLPRSPTR